MSNESFVKLVTHICSKDDRYDIAGYAFLTRALHYKTIKQREVHPNPGLYVLSCRDAFDGFCEYGLEQMGPMAWCVFQEWGIFCAEDVGDMIYYMVDNNLLNEHEGDSYEQFATYPDLEEIMTSPYKCE